MDSYENINLNSNLEIGILLDLGFGMSNLELIWDFGFENWDLFYL